MATWAQACGRIAARLIVEDGNRPVVVAALVMNLCSYRMHRITNAELRSDPCLKEAARRYSRVAFRLGVIRGEVDEDPGCSARYDGCRCSQCKVRRSNRGVMVGVRNETGGHGGSCEWRQPDTIPSGRKDAVK